MSFSKSAMKTRPHKIGLFFNMGHEKPGNNIRSLKSRNLQNTGTIYIHYAFLHCTVLIS